MTIQQSFASFLHLATFFSYQAYLPKKLASLGVWFIYDISVSRDVLGRIERLRIIFIHFFLQLKQVSFFLLDHLLVFLLLLDMPRIILPWRYRGPPRQTGKLLHLPRKIKHFQLVSTIILPGINIRAFLFHTVRIFILPEFLPLLLEEAIKRILHAYLIIRTIRIQHNRCR